MVLLAVLLTKLMKKAGKVLLLLSVLVSMMVLAQVWKSLFSKVS